MIPILKQERQSAESYQKPAQSHTAHAGGWIPSPDLLAQELLVLTGLGTM